MATSVTTAPPTYQELWLVIHGAWTRRTFAMTWEDRQQDPFHLAFMGLSAEHMDSWNVIDRRGSAPQALIDDLIRFIRTWVRPEAAP